MNIKPATPLPWSDGLDRAGRRRIFGPDGIECVRALWKAVKTKEERDQNRAYIVHAANAYPEMVAVFRGWKCPACGGSGEYLNHSATPPHEEIRQCRKCTGSGLDPRATALLGKLGELS